VCFQTAKILTIPYKVIGQKRDAVCRAREEMKLHQKGYQEKKGMPEESVAKKMFDTSVQIYEQIKLEYNETFKKPIYRIPGVLMGFHTIY